MPPPMQGQRNAASPGSAHLWQLGQTISNGVLDAHGRRGRVVLLQSFLVGELHVIEGHQASDKASFHVIHRNQSKLGIPLQRIQWRRWATVVHLAMGHFPVQSFSCDNSFSSVGTQTRRQVSTFHLQCLLVIILPEGEATQPLRSAKEITELRTHRLRILDSLRAEQHPCQRPLAGPARGRGRQCTGSWNRPKSTAKRSASLCLR